MACLRGSAARGAGALRQAKPVFAETGHSHKKRLASEQERGRNSETSL